MSMYDKIHYKQKINKNKNKTSDKEKILNAVRGRHITYRENKEKNDNRALLRQARGQ